MASSQQPPGPAVKDCHLGTGLISATKGGRTGAQPGGVHLQPDVIGYMDVSLALIPNRVNHG